VGIFVCENKLKKSLKLFFYYKSSFYICITIATKLFNKPYQNEKLNQLRRRNAQARPRVHTFSHRHLSNGFYRIHRIRSYNLIMMTWRMKFRYHETGTYYVTMTFADIREANRYIKQEEQSENSEFLTYTTL
jgi:hypothetical protein